MNGVMGNGSPRNRLLLSSHAGTPLVRGEPKKVLKCKTLEKFNSCPKIFVTREQIVRLGIFGGSFDPVHYGHLILAETCREHLALDRVLFIPASTSPLKLSGPRASAAHRVEMLRLAIGGSSHLVVDTCELDRGGVSYTLDTVQSILDRDRPSSLHLLIGADSVSALSAWREPAKLLTLVQLGVVQRAGESRLDFEATRELLLPADRERFSPQLVPMPAIGISSTELRNRVEAGSSIRYRTPRGVEAYIAANALYH